MTFLGPSTDLKQQKCKGEIYNDGSKCKKYINGSVFPFFVRKFK